MFLQNKWWVIAESKAIGKKPVGLKRLGEDLVLWRDNNGKIVCQKQHCPHRGASLTLGKVVDGCIECPYHGFRFAAEGNCTLMPCEGKEAYISHRMRVKSYVVKEVHDLVWLWWGEEKSNYPPIPWFDELQDSPQRWASGTMNWDIPFTRAVEGLLIDLHHFAFAHHRVAWLFGFSSATLLKSFEVEVKDEIIHSRGQLKSETTNKKNSVFNFEHWLYFPNLAIFDFGFGGIKLFVNATPIDKDKTWAYFRYYTPFSSPWISRLISKLSVWIELNFVQPDDYRIFISTEPKESGLKANNFVHADKAIIMWHKMYDSQIGSIRILQK